ncbi:MAG TPA: RNase adapter RapZ [Candidatus Acidoferrales bacterium]|nr:RNase adapter RapZ [Candidatus Acidoferrales bacterium]
MSVRRLVIVTGLSGAGKSQALAAFEDLGFYCLDNLPPTLLPQIVTLAAASGYDRLAIAPDVRTSGPFGDLTTSIASASTNGASPEILFLDATEEALVRRFSETRRKHPIARERLTEAIASERSALAPVRDRAARVWDTSAMTAIQLRRRIAETYAQQTGEPVLHVTLVSFGYKYGLPLDADMVFDVRFLPNPYYVDELRELTGLDKPVGDYLERLPETRTFLDHAETLLDFLIPRFIEEGKAQLTIAIGCTGGRHRSVYLAERLRQFLEKNDQLSVELAARDIHR